MSQHSDFYCERVNESVLGEPFNSISSIAFLIAAIAAYYPIRKQKLCVTHVLCAALVLIFITSVLIHTTAQTWSLILDAGSILFFFAIYLFASIRDLLNVYPVIAATISICFSMVIAAISFLIPTKIPSVGFTVAYFPFPCLLVLIASTAFFFNKSKPAIKLIFGAAAFCIALVLRWIDISVCQRLKVGTHFIWHLLSAIVYSWLIFVYTSHRVESDSSRRESKD